MVSSPLNVHIWQLCDEIRPLDPAKVTKDILMLAQNVTYHGSSANLRDFGNTGKHKISIAFMPSLIPSIIIHSSFLH